MTLTISINGTPILPGGYVLLNFIKNEVRVVNPVSR